MEEEYDDRKIEELNISEKTKKVLRKIGIKYVRQLANRDIRRTYELVILGNKYVEELEEQLYMLGIDLKNERDEAMTMDKFKKWREENASKVLTKEKSQDTKDKDGGYKDKNNEVKYDRDKGAR